MSEFLKWFAMLLSLLDGDPAAAAAAAAAPAEEPICIISDACLTYKTMREKLVNKDKFKLKCDAKVDIDVVLKKKIRILSFLDTAMIKLPCSQYVLSYIL